MAQTLRLQALGKDLGLHVAIDVLSDATAAIGIARRLGMKQIRQLYCTGLRIQKKKHFKQISLEKVLGSGNSADAMTKCIDHAIITTALQKLKMK